MCEHRIYFLENYCVEKKKTNQVSNEMQNM